jgi:legumain
MAAAAWLCGFLSLLAVAAAADGVEGEWEPLIRMPTEKGVYAAAAAAAEDEVGTRWAVLVAGSSGYGNYRHQVSPAAASSVISVI